VALAGLLLAAGGPAPNALDKAIAKALKTPQLFEITATRDGQPLPGARSCLDAAAVKQLASVAPAPADRPRLARPGCVTAATYRPDGSFRTERICEAAKGAPFDSRGVTEGTVSLMRNRLEVTLSLGSGPARRIVGETVVRRVGPCPADLKPGEMRLSDGRVVSATDLAAEALQPARPVGTLD
jgi:hypothetical protein